MSFKEIKEVLKKQVSTIKFFDRNTYEIILKDQETAKKILKDGGDVQEFYKNSDTTRTKFYIENGGAYCELVSIMA